MTIHLDHTHHTLVASHHGPASAQRLAGLCPPGGCMKIMRGVTPCSA